MMCSVEVEGRYAVDLDRSLPHLGGVTPARNTADVE